MRQYVLWQLNERPNGDPGKSLVIGFVKTETGSLTVFPSSPGHPSPDSMASQTRADWPRPGMYEDCELYQAHGATTAHAYPVIDGQSILLPGTDAPVDIAWKKGEGKAEVIASIMIDDSSYARVFLPIDDDYRNKPCAAHIRDLTEGWGSNRPGPGDITTCYLYYIVSNSRLVGYALPVKSTSMTAATQAATWIAETAIVVVTDGAVFRKCEVEDDGSIRTIRLRR